MEQECQGLQYQVEVRNITQKIEILTEKLDTAFSLGEPRENAFLTCDFTLNDSLDQIQQHLGILGKGKELVLHFLFYWPVLNYFC